MFSSCGFGVYQLGSNTFGDPAVHFPNQPLPWENRHSDRAEPISSSGSMDEWLAEFKHWVSEEEEFEAFAQPLCQQFQNWTTEEEEYLKYSDEFLNL